MVLKLHIVLSQNCSWAPIDLHPTTVQGNMYCNIASLIGLQYTGKYRMTSIIRYNIASLRATIIYYSIQESTG